MAASARTPNPWLGLALLGGGCLVFAMSLWQQAVQQPAWHQGLAGPPSAWPIHGTVPEMGGARPAVGAPASFADVVERVGKGVVAVQAHLPPREPSDTAQRHRSGSGFVVHPRGLLVTCRHVVAGAKSITVWLAGEPYAAVLVGADRAADLALLRLDAPPPDLVALPLGPSEQLRSGDWIVALGNPLGLAQSVTVGVVSHPGRQLPHSDFALTNEFLQCSAPVNPGCSGGPLVDLHGRVVGVTTQAAASAQGISFAVPSRTLQWTLEAMEKSRDGQVRHGSLGIEFRSAKAPDGRGATHRGALVVRVVEGQAAERAGVRAGDLVVSVDGEPVDDARQLHQRIVHGEPGARLALSVLRGGRVVDPIVAELGELGGRASDPAN
ncbi:MAG: trypsin-like peptidase domain-containing protein [Planctomycetes bacterium]|nr:trypsin-like peptidase domain-containing protein [Planctomycetota bacterium]